MAQPYVGEVRMFGGNFAPAGWHFCNGTPLPIVENETLFHLIGTTYGGDGQSTFCVPDLRGRAPVHQIGPASPYQMGDQGGVESVTLGINQIPTHTHAFVATTGGGSSTTPQNNLTAANNSPKLYLADGPTTQLAANAAVPAGGSQPHDNMQPYIAINYIISLFGIFPSET